jgi:hypothetical protein
MACGSQRMLMKSWASPSAGSAARWFLALLFVSPGQQGRGIGQQLLNRTFAHAGKANAAVRALITFAFNGVSQGLYVRHGLLPGCPIYNLTAENGNRPPDAHHNSDGADVHRRFWQLDPVSAPQPRVHVIAKTANGTNATCGPRRPMSAVGSRTGSTRTSPFGRS